MNHLLFTVRWLDERYHGLIDREGPPEWPPSPYRLFQALVAGLARGGELDSQLGRSLEWLQTLAPPLILAPRSRPGQVVTRYVPNNDGDKVPHRQGRLTDKTSRPTLMMDPPEVHYVWDIKPEDVSLAERACGTARYLTCLGWGIDLAFADAKLIANDDLTALSGVRWQPRKHLAREDGLLRVPIFDHEMGIDSLSDLKRAYQSAIN